MQEPTLIPVLGHECVLDESTEDPRRRVCARLGDRLLGVAAFEPLFGPHAEGVIALAPDGSEALVPYLLDELLQAATASGLTVVRFVLPHAGQRRTAEHLAATRCDGTLRREFLEVRPVVAQRLAS